jgi:hypothetical protein
MFAGACAAAAPEVLDVGVDVVESFGAGGGGEVAAPGGRLFALTCDPPVLWTIPSRGSVATAVDPIGVVAAVIVVLVDVVLDCEVGAAVSVAAAPAAPDVPAVEVGPEADPRAGPGVDATPSLAVPVEAEDEGSVSAEP